MTDFELRQAERVTKLETEVFMLRTTVLDMDKKIDELIILKSKGLGAFWLASSLVGTGIIGFIGMCLDYIRS